MRDNKQKRVKHPVKGGPRVRNTLNTREGAKEGERERVRVTTSERLLRQQEERERG